MEGRLGVPEEVGDVEHVAAEVDVDAGHEEPAHDADDFLALHAEVAAEREAAGDGLRRGHGVGHALLEEGELGRLRDGVRHGELDHVVAAAEGDHVVEDARPGDRRVVFEVEFLGFEVVFVLGAHGEGDVRDGVAGGARGGGEGQVGEEVFFLAGREVPEDDDAVGEDEHFGEGG